MNLSEQELIDLYQYAPCGFHSLDAEGCFVTINDTELRWLGYRAEEVIGQMKLTDILTDEGKRAFEEFFPHLKRTGRLRDLELDLVRKNGARLPVLVSATAVCDQYGRFVMSRSVLWDLSERKRAEMRFRAILEAAPDAMIVCDRQGKIVLANSQVETIFGYSRRELTGQPIETLVPQRLRAGHEQHRADFFSHPQTRPMGAGSELSGRRKDGSEVSVEISLSPLELDEGLAVAAVRDIAARRGVEQNARRQEEQYRLLFENSLDGILRTAPDGRIFDANPSACKIMGRTREELIAAGRAGAVDTDDPRLASLLEERAKTGRAHGELTGRRSDGTTFHGEVSSVIFHDPDGTESACTIFRDITERKRAEEERERLVKELQNALGEVKMLSGLLSICASCKRIRDEHGHWETLEVYIRDHSAADFSHAVCPECLQKLYPEYVKK